MADRVITPNIRIGDAAAAIGMETKALRNWFAKGKVTMLDTRESAKGWRGFSFADVAWLAIMREFVWFGFEVDTAEAFAGTVLSKALGPKLETAAQLAPNLFEAMLEGWKATAHRLTNGEPILVMVAPGREPLIVTAALLVNVRAVVAYAFAALERAGYDRGAL
jgi:hypothetical protein